MATTLRADCPRCGTEKITFDVHARNQIGGLEYGWVSYFETFGVCRDCHASTVHVVRLREIAGKTVVLKDAFWSGDNHLNDLMEVRGFISLKDRVAFQPPEHIPDQIAAIYREGATCTSVECFNAAATMFRLCLDLATKPLLPDPADPAVPQPTKYQRWNLKPRIEWLLEQRLLPGELAEVLDNLREDGNDGAHAGTLGSEDAADVADFAYLLLERLYTDPQRLKLARERREQRRAPPKVQDA